MGTTLLQGSVSNIMHTSHVCVTLTSRIYFLLTLAQGKKAAPEGKVNFSVGLSAVRTSLVCRYFRAT